LLLHPKEFPKSKLLSRDAARDAATGKEKNIRVQSTGGLTDADIKRMVNEAEAHAEEDRKHKERSEAVNHADSIIYDSERQIREHSAALDQAKLAEFRTEMDALRKLNTDTTVAPEIIKQKADQLQQSSIKLFEVIYQNQKTNAAAGDQSQQQQQQQQQQNEQQTNQQTNQHDSPDANEKK